jgi:Flp pilus assembly protein TadG
MSEPSHRLRGDRDRGAALVEFAIVLPILGALLIGMLSGGITFNRKLSLTNGAREGARYGATLPVTNFANTNAWLDSVAAVAVGAVDDTLPTSAAGRVVCIAYVDDPAGAADFTLRRMDSGGTVGYAASRCFNDGRPASEQRVQVVLQRTSEINALIYKQTITVTGRSVARYEALAG